MITFALERSRLPGRAMKSLASLALAAVLVAGPAAGQEELTASDLVEVCQDSELFKERPESCLALATPLAACANRLHRQGPESIFALLFAVAFTNGIEDASAADRLEYIGRCARGEPPFDDE